jgi:hypothetical protein
VAFRGDRPWRAPLLRFFPLQRSSCAALSDFATSSDDPASAFKSAAPCVGRTELLLLRFFAGTRGGFSDTPAPVRPGSCTVDLLCGDVPLPGRTSRNLAGFFRSGNAPGVQDPSQLCSCPRVRAPFGVERPPAVFRAFHPDNFRRGVGHANATPTTLARPTAESRRGFWVFSPRAIRSDRTRSGWNDAALGFGLSQVFGHRKHRHAGG